QTVRLIRSKGVGIFFVTQSPTDVPDNVLAQLGSRVQHQLRAHTPNDAKALKATVGTYPTSQYDLAETLQSLGIGEAIITVLNPDGAPTPVAWTRMLAPAASMGAMPADWLSNGVASSPLQAKYGQDINRDSAYEMLTQRLEAGAAKAQQEADAAARAKEQAAQDKTDAAQQRASAPRAPSRSSSRPAPRSGVEKVLGSATFWNQVIRVGGQVVRTMWGTAKR
ncbi:MAG: helicase HerA-like domain-containing protein, partial [Propionicimonas sp.]